MSDKPRGASGALGFRTWLLEIGVAIATSGHMDSALILPTPAVLCRVRVIQLVAKQDYATALQCLPTLGFWDSWASRVNNGTL